MMAITTSLQGTISLSASGEGRIECHVLFSLAECFVIGPRPKQGSDRRAVYLQVG